MNFRQDRRLDFWFADCHPERLEECGRVGPNGISDPLRISLVAEGNDGVNPRGPARGEIACNPGNRHDQQRYTGEDKRMFHWSLDLRN